MKLTVIISSSSLDETPFIPLLKSKFKELDLIEFNPAQEDIPQKIKHLNPKILFIHYDYFIANRETAREYFQYVPFIILISNKSEDVLNSIHHGAFDFINYKTVTETEIALVLARINAAIKERDNQRKIGRIYSFIEFGMKHRFKTKNGFSFVSYKDILSIESDGKYCKIQLTDAQSLDVVLKIGKIIGELPQNIFFRINRSAIINLHYISRINTADGTVTLKSNDFIKKYKIPVSISKSKIMELTKHND